MGCSSTMTMYSYTCAGSFYGPEVFSTQRLPNPCCPDPCTQIVLDSQDGPTTSYGSVTCVGTNGGVVGGSSQTVKTKYIYGCEPIDPPPPGCTTSTTNPPPPDSSCDNSGGGN
jgi:hypothetical protein